MSSDIAIKAVGLKKEFKDLGRPTAQLLNAFNLASDRIAPRKKVLNGLDFTISKGEKVGILGMNGAGKSTLLQIMAGNSKQTSGELEINGRIGAILELGAGFHPDLTGRQNAETLLLLGGMGKADIPATMEWIIQFSGLAENIDFRTRTYSSGMLVRLAFAVATCGNPEVFFVDEALAVGDAAFQQKCYSHLQTALAASTLVLISHDLAAVAALCDRAIVLDGGRIVFDGSPQSAFPIYNRIIHGNGPSADAVGLDADGVVSHACKSGPRELDIKTVKFTVNGEHTTTVLPGDLVKVSLSVDNPGDAVAFIAGVSVADIKGQVLFGQNSELLPEMWSAHGLSLVDLEFYWPRVASGSYFLTVGIASSFHGIHRVQCWANNVLHINAILDQNPHGLFNIDLVSVNLEKPNV